VSDIGHPEHTLLN